MQTARRAGPSIGEGHHRDVAALDDVGVLRLAPIARLDDLQGSWRGSAATNFQALITEWTLTQGRVEASLASINTALASAAATYAQAEQGNTQRFS